MSQFQNVTYASATPVFRRSSSWWRVLLTGIVLFAIATIILFWTGNPNLYPTVILIGNFLIPIVFVAFLYDHRHISSLTPVVVASSFCIGGILGVLGASVLEAILLPVPSGPDYTLSLTSGIIIGLIEEGCKIVAVIFLARRLPHTSQMDGLLLGGAVGMGFAALESTGYAFTAFLLSHGHIGASIVSTVLRGLLAPFGHGIWTGILGAVIFRESTPRHFRLTGTVVLTYLFVSLLHGMWDGLPHSIVIVFPPGIPVSLFNLLISILGIVTLAVLYRRAVIQQVQMIR